MIYPKFLPQNGVIGLCAPSYGIACEPYLSRYQSAKETFLEKGYQIIESEHIYEFNALKEIRANEFMQLFKNPKIDIIFSVAGGDYMYEILEYLDFEVLKRYPPKYFVGFSDNTNLTMLLTTMLDIGSIYAPNFTSYGMKPWHKALDDFLDLITGKKLIFHSYEKYEEISQTDLNYLSGYNCTKDVNWKSNQKEITIKGRIIGGCIDVLMMHLGTKYDHFKMFSENYNEIILYLETFDFDLLKMKSAIWQLKQAGWFKKCVAIIFGRMPNLNENYQELYDAFEIPVIYDADIGHIPPMIPILNGAMVKIHYLNAKATFQFELK